MNRDWEADATVAVVAHSLLSSMTVIEGGLKLVLDRWERLTPEQRGELLNAALDQALHVSGIFGDLIRGLPAAALELLERGTSSSTAT
jgi:hypothetical protein